MIKCQQKISGSFRSYLGACTFARICCKALHFFAMRWDIHFIDSTSLIEPSHSNIYFL